MLEIVVCSLFAGSLGLQAMVVSGWMHWQHVEGNQDEEEEELLTQYEQTENNTVEQPQPNSADQEQSRDPRLVGWEFKIVRAQRNLFGDLKVLQQLCQEEAEAGWILLEKLDDRRVRFKRPIALREIVKQEYLKLDPYRCHYGSSWHPLTWLGAIAVLTAMILPAYLGYTLVSKTVANPQEPDIPATFPPLEQSPSP